MEPESSMSAADEDLVRIAAPTDRRPDFIAEALSPAFRIGLLLAVLTAEAGLIGSIATVAIRPGALVTHGLGGPLLVGGTLVLTFALFLIFGALVANNRRLTARRRVLWYASFLFGGPVMLPSYWLMHIWNAPFEPGEQNDHGRAPARSTSSISRA